MPTPTYEPRKESLWEECLHEAIKAAQERGDDYVAFADVDNLVIDRSKVVGSREL